MNWHIWWVWVWLALCVAFALGALWAANRIGREAETRGRHYRRIP